MEKVIKLQSLKLTKKKYAILDKNRTEAKRLINKFLLPVMDSCKDNGELQQKVYHIINFKYIIYYTT